MKIKRLDPPFKPFLDSKLVKSLIEDLTKCQVEINPIFNKNGRYYERITNYCWLELNNRAWEFCHKDFLFDLSILETKCLSLNEVEAIKTLKKYNNCPDSLRRNLYYHSINQYGRKIKLDGKKRMKLIKDNISQNEVEK